MRRTSFAPEGAAAFFTVVALVVVALVFGGGSASAQEPVLQPINTDGLLPLPELGSGDPGNTRIASMAWFKGDFYVATERWTHCVFAAVMSERYHIPVYPPSPDCAPDPTDLTLAAEIWRFSLSDFSWELVFTSPEDVPVAFDAFGSPTKFIARDISFRAMAVVTEADGTEALYAGGTTYSGKLGVPSAFPPRLLRSVDGTTWTAVPQAPGSLLGDLGQPLPESALLTTGFDQLVSLDGGTLVAVVTTGPNDHVRGMLIASDDPGAGGDSWFAASPPPEEFPITGAVVFDGRLYVGVDSPYGKIPYSIYRSDGSGSIPFSFVPVVVNDPEATPGVGRGWTVSFAEHSGRLYATAGWPLEVVRIDSDDDWEVVVGTRRSSPDGSNLLAPTSGISAGFGNPFNVQGASMGSDGASLYLGTIDTTLIAALAPSLSPLFQHEFGFDLLRSEEGVYWYPVSKVGLGVPTQYGVSTLMGTPLGVGLGSLGVGGGAQAWFGASVAPATATGGLPYRVEAAAGTLAGDEVILSWENDPGVVAYHVYRSEVTPVLEALGVSGARLLANLDEGDPLCQISPELCESLRFFRDDFGLSGPFELIGTTTDPYYVEDPPTSLQSMYFVRAERADGSISGPSNFVGAVSTAIPMTFPLVSDDILTRLQNDELGIAAMRSLTMVRRAAHAVSGGRLPAARRMLEVGEAIVEAQRGASISDADADDLCLMLYRLRRNVQLAEWLLIDPASLQ